MQLIFIHGRVRFEPRCNVGAFFCIFDNKPKRLELLEILCKRHEDWLNMARKLNAEHPEDIVQEMYLRLNKYVDNADRICYDHNEPNTFYIYCTIKNLIINEYKDAERHPVMLSAEEIRQHSDNLLHTEDYDHETDEVLEAIESEIDQWYWYDRDMFNLYFKGDMSMRKLSQETRISTSSIFNTIKNGKEKIKHALNKAGKL